jgi:hypothetical protein
MDDATEFAMRAALRHAGAVAAIDPLATLKDKLALADRMLLALMQLRPIARYRRIRLLDAVLGLAHSKQGDE